MWQSAGQTFGKSRGGMRLPQRFTALFDAVPLSRIAIPSFDRRPFAGVTVVTTSKLHCFYMIRPGKMFASRIRNRHHADCRGGGAGNSYRLKDAIRENAKIFHENFKSGKKRRKKVKENHEVGEKLTMRVIVGILEFQRRAQSRRFKLRPPVQRRIPTKSQFRRDR